MNRKSKIIVSVVGIVIVTLALLGITYAYYLTRIEGNTNTNSISVSTADLKLKYDDGNGNIVENDIMPGKVITKDFSVTNDGQSKVEGYLVVLENVHNTLNRKEDLVYKLVCKLPNGNSCGTTEENFYPTSSISIIFTNDIDKNVTHNYTLTVTYKNHDNIDQSEDMGKSFSGRVNIMDANTNIYKTGVASTDNNSLVYNIINNAMNNANIKPDYGTEYRINTMTKPGTDDYSYVYDLSHLIIIEPTSYQTITPTNQYYVYGDCVEHPAGGLIPWIDEPKVLNKEQSFEMLKGKCISNINGYNTKEEAQDMANQIGEGLDLTEWIYVGNNTSNKTISYGNADLVYKKEQTLSTTQDDLGTSYFYRGAVQDNYVLFNNMCFRIVRIEGDGSTKLIYAGDVTPGATTCNEVGESTGFVKENGEIKKVMYGTKEKEFKYVYYSDYWDEYFEYNTHYFSEYDEYEGGLKDTIENWFNTKFTTDVLKNKIKTDKWCLGGNINYIYDLYTKELVNDNQEWINSMNFMEYGFSAVIRALSQKTSLMCENEDFVVSKYGTISLDEVLLAGGRYINFYGYKGGYNDTEYYINDNSKNQAWWLLSYAGDYAGSPSSCYYDDEAMITEVEAGYDLLAVRPVITLIPGITISGGDGTKLNPYVIN